MRKMNKCKKNFCNNYRKNCDNARNVKNAKNAKNDKCDKFCDTRNPIYSD